MEKNWTLNYIILDNILNNNKNLINKTINKYNIVSNKENNKSTSLIDYEKIMNLISKENNIELYTEFKALELLEIEKNIIEFLNNYISNKYLNTDIFLKSLNKLNFISDILSNKLNLQEIKSKKKIIIFLKLNINYVNINLIANIIMVIIIINVWVNIMYIIFLKMIFKI